MVPTPTRDYTDDKTAFDAAVLFTDENGHPGLASVETKYTDKLKDNRAKNEEKKFALANKLRLFTTEGQRWYDKKGFNQVARNLLLTLAYADKHDCRSAINYVLGPRDDPETLGAIQKLKSRMAPEYQDRIVWLPLETAVERGLTVGDEFYRDHLRRFHRRYLDFSQIDHLLASR